MTTKQCGYSNNAKKITNSLVKKKSFYSRRGYLDKSMNSDDLVWNARLSRSFFKGQLTLLLDGFDILGQLNNVTRTMNAQGITETYSNVIPRYVMLHAVYHFNIIPKKKCKV